MFDKQLGQMLESMLAQMNPAQKEKLANILKDKNSFSKAVADIDPKKAKETVKRMNLVEDGADMDTVINTLKNDPTIIDEIKKKF